MSVAFLPLIVLRLGKLQYAHPARDLAGQPIQLFFSKSKPACSFLCFGRGESTISCIRTGNILLSLEAMYSEVMIVHRLMTLKKRKKNEK